MRIRRLIVIACLSLLLAACATSLLVGNAQSKLMWSLLKPLVGFNPYEIDLLEHPFIKSRMQSLLGSHYETTIKLLNTASELQQDGALFYLVSRYAPPQFQEITDKAGLVWNADTNQMAVLLIKEGIPTVFAEPIEDAVGAVVPTWPAELRAAIDEAERYQQQLSKEALQNRAANHVGEIISDTLGLDPDSKTLVDDLLKGKSAEEAGKDHLIKKADDLLHPHQTLPEATDLPQPPQED